MKLQITEHDLRKYLDSKSLSLSETIFDEIKALHHKTTPTAVAWRMQFRPCSSRKSAGRTTRRLTSRRRCTRRVCWRWSGVVKKINEVLTSLALDFLKTAGVIVLIVGALGCVLSPIVVFGIVATLDSSRWWQWWLLLPSSFVSFAVIRGLDKWSGD